MRKALMQMAKAQTTVETFVIFEKKKNKKHESLSRQRALEKHV